MRALGRAYDRIIVAGRIWRSVGEMRRAEAAYTEGLACDIGEVTR